MDPRTVGVALGRLLVLAAFVTFVVGLAPHLVHHLFEPDAAHDDCPFAAASERAQPIVGPAITLVAGGAPVARVPASPCPAAGPSHSRRPDARAPPRSA
ncbi:MAG: hypothetical protein K6T92_01495 [Candidatus Rokubacteria bacterium]|nr:hypothetical protein [Candidatus Rokubacteria bacterium]